MKRNDWITILIFIFLFIFIRAVYYGNVFRFIYDQVASSTVVLELWQNQDVSLIGPPMSLTIGNRQIFFGGVSYYIQMAFLLMGRWDPFWSTYIFMIFSSAMILPLYVGVKKLINRNAAITMTIVYSLLPFYIEGTTQLWNPYFQLALLPGFILLMAFFNKKQSPLLALSLGVYIGILFQLHYQFLIVMVGLAVYYFLVKKISWKLSLFAAVGIIIGFGNMILFELRNDFYTIRTLIIFFQQSEKIASHPQADYYFMSILFFGLLVVLYYARKYISFKINTILFIILALLAIEYTIISGHNKNYPKDWYYENDKQVFQIIQDNYLNSDIRDFNIFQFYAATGDTQKYYMKLNNIDINYNDYYNNEYLYVVYNKDLNYMKDAAYEINTFTPHHLINIWNINSEYNLYLLKRDILNSS